jgi:hypothetical protein
VVGGLPFCPISIFHHFHAAGQPRGFVPRLEPAMMSAIPGLSHSVNREFTLGSLIEALTFIQIACATGRYR